MILSRRKTSINLWQFLFLAAFCLGDICQGANPPNPTKKQPPGDARQSAIDRISSYYQAILDDHSAPPDSTNLKIKPKPDANIPPGDKKYTDTLNKMLDRLDPKIRTAEKETFGNEFQNLVGKVYDLLQSDPHKVLQGTLQAGSAQDTHNVSLKAMQSYVDQLKMISSGKDFKSMVDHPAFAQFASNLTKKLNFSGGVLSVEATGPDSKGRTTTWTYFPKDAEGHAVPTVRAQFGKGEKGYSFFQYNGSDGPWRRIADHHFTASLPAPGSSQLSAVSTQRNKAQSQLSPSNLDLYGSQGKANEKGGYYLDKKSVLNDGKGNAVGYESGGALFFFGKNPPDSKGTAKDRSQWALYSKDGKFIGFYNQLVLPNQSKPRTVEKEELSRLQAIGSSIKEGDQLTRVNLSDNLWTLRIHQDSKTGAPIQKDIPAFRLKDGSYKGLDGTKYQYNGRYYIAQSVRPDVPAPGVKQNSVADPQPKATAQPGPLTQLSNMLTGLGATLTNFISKPMIKAEAGNSNGNSKANSTTDKEDAFKELKESVLKNVSNQLYSSDHEHDAAMALYDKALYRDAGNGIYEISLAGDKKFGNPDLAVDSKGNIILDYSRLIQSQSYLASVKNAGLKEIKDRDGVSSFQDTSGKAISSFDAFLRIGREDFLSNQIGLRPTPTQGEINQFRLQLRDAEIFPIDANAIERGPNSPVAVKFFNGNLGISQEVIVSGSGEWRPRPSEVNDYMNAFGDPNNFIQVNSPNSFPHVQEVPPLN